MRSLPRALRSTRLVLGVLASCLALTASACSAAPAEDADDAAASLATPGERPGVGRAVPALRVETLADGLDHPWDVKPIGGGRLLFRCGYHHPRPCRYLPLPARATIDGKYSPGRT